jgi:phospho-2-dehydro-3-deoxyheptonate aldolase
MNGNNGGQIHGVMITSDRTFGAVNAYTGYRLVPNAHSQKLGDKGAEGLKYGQSITDACVGLDDTAAMLEVLAKGVRDRRLKAAK